MFQSANIKRKPDTMFVDPSHTHRLKKYLLKKLNLQNLLILNNTVWFKIKQDVNYFKTIAKKIKVTGPVIRIRFNQLQFNNYNIASKLTAKLLEDTLIICR